MIGDDCSGPTYADQNAGGLTRQGYRESGLNSYTAIHLFHFIFKRSPFKRYKALKYHFIFKCIPFKRYNAFKYIY